MDKFDEAPVIWRFTHPLIRSSICIFSPFLDQFKLIATEMEEETSIIRTKKNNLHKDLTWLWIDEILKQSSDEKMRSTLWMWWYGAWKRPLKIYMSDWEITKHRTVSFPKQKPQHLIKVTLNAVSVNCNFNVTANLLLLLTMPPGTLCVFHLNAQPSYRLEVELHNPVSSTNLWMRPSISRRLMQTLMNFCFSVTFNRSKRGESISKVWSVSRDLPIKLL